MSDENTFDFALYLGTTTPLTITINPKAVPWWQIDAGDVVLPMQIF